MKERRTENMSFGLAIVAAKDGHEITRKAWNSEDIFVFRQRAFAGFEDFMAIDTTGFISDSPSAPNRCVVPWVPSQIDMLANDWFIVG